MSKAIIFDIKRFAVHDGPGIRTTVFFKGCTMNCWWCHNPESIAEKPVAINRILKLGDESYTRSQTIGKEYSPEELVTEIAKDRVFMDESGGGVTLSGGEPLVQHQFLSALLPMLKKQGFHIALDTCGFVPGKVMESVVPFIDLFLFDLKHPDAEMHKKYTGADLSVIIDNFNFLAAKNCTIRVRIPFIPGINDSEKCIAGFMDILNQGRGAIQQVDILAYHKIADNKYKRFALENRMTAFAEPDEKATESFADAFRKAGFNVTIGG